MESFFGLVFVITEHCLLLKFVLEKRLREGYFGRGEKISFLMVYRFADDLIRCVHNEDASPLRSYSDSSSLSSTCMPTRVFVTILCSAVSRILKTMNLLQILTKSSRLLWPPTSSQRQLGGQLFSSFTCDDKNHFLYMLLQLFAMHKPRLQAPSDYISDVFVSLDPWPQHHSCSFRFK